MAEYTNGSPVPTTLDRMQNGRVNPLDLAFAEFVRMTDAAQQELYRHYREYYDGDHDTMLTDRMRAFLQVKNDSIEFHLNYLPVPVDVLAERLTVAGFSVEGEDEGTADEQRQGGSGGWLQRWWDANRMDAMQGDNHTAAVRDGDSYMIVEWDNDSGRPSISHELAYDGTYGCHVLYREDKARRIRYAVKEWRVESGNNAGHLRRRNIYTPDAIYKYQIGRGGWEPYLETDENGNEQPWPLPWVDKTGKPLGVPVFHFPYNPGGNFFGKSELKDLIPAQNALNKSVIDELAAADSTGFQILTLTGEKPPEGMEIASGKLMWAENPEAKYGSIPPGDLSGLSAIVEKFVQRMAQISRIPLSYFQVTGAIASADTQKADDTGLVSKAEKTAVNFGNGWEDVMTMCRKLHNTFGSGPELPELQISTEWAPFERVDKQASARTKAETAEIKARTYDTLLLSNPRGDRYKLALLAGYDEDEASILAESDIRLNAQANGLPNLNADGEGVAGATAENLTTDKGLNGAQITAAIGVLTGVVDGTTTELVAIELLVSVGISRERAARMVADTKAKALPVNDSGGNFDLGGVTQ